MNKVITKGNSVLASYGYDYYMDGHLRNNVFNISGKAQKAIIFQYDQLGRLKTETSTRNGVTDAMSYTYDSSGNRSSLSVTGTQNYTTNYTYDANNRLLTETTVRPNVAENEITKYLYDKNGNTLNKKSGTINVLRQVNNKEGQADEKVYESSIFSNYSVSNFDFSLFALS